MAFFRSIKEFRYPLSTIPGHLPFGKPAGVLLDQFQRFIQGGLVVKIVQEFAVSDHLGLSDILFHSGLYQRFQFAEPANGHHPVDPFVDITVQPVSGWSNAEIPKPVHTPLICPIRHKFGFDLAGLVVNLKRPEHMPEIIRMDAPGFLGVDFGQLGVHFLGSKLFSFAFQSGSDRSDLPVNQNQPLGQRFQIQAGPPDYDGDMFSGDDSLDHMVGIGHKSDGGVFFTRFDQVDQMNRDSPKFFAGWFGGADIQILDYLPRIGGDNLDRESLGQAIGHG